ncbi:MAG: DUF1499 domain-containing protein [Verrucomicrobiae bacterium]|nr:DUF1499 domain-containing protein [Verrucomicrobiae bacterium]
MVRVVNGSLPAPPHLGVNDGHLAGCPASPNCVGSQGEEGSHRVEPLRFSDIPAAAWARLHRALGGMRGATLVREEPNYRHYAFRTAVFGFVDDVELLLDEESRVIHVRSASRRGHSDLGTNRRRVEAIRARFAPTGSEI